MINGVSPTTRAIDERKSPCRTTIFLAYSDELKTLQLY